MLPEYYEKPIGGYKVVFEYANRLSSIGHTVTIVYPYFLFFQPSSLKRKGKMIFFFLFYKFFKRKGVTSWFPLNNSIVNRYVITLAENNIPDADYYFATAMETAVHLERYKNVPSSKKYYLIQAIEDWQWGRQAAIDTWKLNLNKIVVSDWLFSCLNEVGQSAITIENGVNRNGLSKIIPCDKKDKYTIMMLYHKQKLKGCEDGLSALIILKDKYPSLKSIWFGCPDSPPNLPSWITYYKMPSEELLNELYNQAGIFIGTSYSEGFGLTVGEAMSCGCAIACTDAGGYLTMAKHRHTALISPKGNVDALVGNVAELIENDVLRVCLAENGFDYIQSFTWDRAFEKFKSLFY